MSPFELGIREYLEGLVGLLVVIVGIAAASLWVRERLLPDWSGSPARLAEAILGIFLLTAAALVLGTFGLLSVVGLVVASVVLALVAEWWSRTVVAGGARGGSSVSDRGGSPPAVPSPRGAVPAAVAVVVGAFALWGVAVSWSIDEGITNFDSVWYHLPFAAEMAQSGSTLGLHRTETVFLNWFYPQGAELVHAVGMVMTGRDAVSPAVNVGWLGLAFLAAWCIGRPYGRGHLTVAAVAILLTCHNLFAREPGSAKNDIAAIALLLAAAALLVNAARVGRPAPAAAGGGTGTGMDGGASPAQRPWPILLAALAAGLAVGVKVTVLAPVAVLAVASVALTPTGRRAAAATLWLAGLLAGGGYWYARNIVVAGNPLPQVREIGPLSLPGPESLQTGRPDFTVAHYLTDTGVWRDHFLPGLERGFGALWPLVIGLAVLGAGWAAVRLWRLRGAARGRDAPVVAGGIAALAGMAAYLVTPLGAAGAEGEPTAFAINLRFVIPSLVLGIAFVPLLTAGWTARATWAVFIALALLAVVTNGFDRALLEPGGRLFGWSLALGAVAIPAILLFAWRRLIKIGRSDGTGGASRQVEAWRGPIAVVLVAVLAGSIVAVAAAGYSLQRTYFDGRYADFDPELGMAEPYRWASGTSGESIALVGTTAGFRGYGFYGPLLDNSVTYLGREAPAGGFHPIATCGELREAVNTLAPDYLVTAPFLNFLDPDRPLDSPERRWIENAPAATAILEGEGPGRPVTVWSIDGELEPGGCGTDEEPLEEIPDSPTG